ncbi:diguanylate cyclase domain-containing protein [Planococcus sp. YIM B11945]|uniref:diguanylate cyclase domain-containing protein n=1 Tax=Planococcus sp. YIM B11945 TaxID=3435410 RepID=UPI003D7E5BBD
MNEIDDMIFVKRVDGDFNFVYEFINQAVLDKTDMDFSAMGKSLEEAHPDLIWLELEKQYNEVLKQRKKLSFEKIYDSPSGEKIYLMKNSTPIFDDLGNCTHIVSIVKDVTAQRNLELKRVQTSEKLSEMQSQYRSLFDNNVDPILIIGLDGKVRGGNAASDQLGGFSIAELKGSDFLSFIESEDRERANRYFSQATERKSEDFRAKFVDKFGEAFSNLIKFNAIEVKDEIVGIYAILKDMRELDKMSYKYIQSDKLFRIIAENAHDVIALINHRREFLYVSPSSEDVFGYLPNEYTGKMPFYTAHPEDVPLVEQKLVQAVQSGITCKLRLRIQHKVKGWIWSELHGTPVYDEHQKFKHMVIIVRDITLQKEYESKLEFFAYHDSLTELPNRRYFMERLSEEIKQLGKTEERFALIMLDINDFKSINDVFGHETGDYVIKEFGKRLEEAKGQNSIAARLGGDEFVVLAGKVQSEEEALAAVEQILKALELPWHIQNSPLQVTTSIGIAMASTECADASALLKQADLAMYKAKNAGKNSYQFSRL